MSANFSPELNGYTGVQPFRFWCQKILPLVYDDSLSYYELLCKVVDYLNKVIEDLTTTENNVGALAGAYDELQDYVNDKLEELETYMNEYFDNLDVQDEINNKLDEMATSGTLSELINPFIPTAVSSWLSENVDPVGSAVIVDSSLSVSGAAADAKVVGDAVTALENNVNEKTSGLWSLKAPTPATMNMYEKKVFDTDIGFAPQGIAVYGDIAYVCNGYTEPRNVIGEINLVTGSYTVHTIEDMSENGCNCLTLDYANKILYASDHNIGPRVYAIDLDSWEVIGTYTMKTAGNTNIGSANIVYSPLEDCFYTCNDKTTLYKLDKEFKEIEHWTLRKSDSNLYPTHNDGTTQAFGYDGTYFYEPRSEVEAVDGNSMVFVYDKCGNLVKHFYGFHDEIEDYAYDYFTGKSYMCYARGETGYITEFVRDSGWLNLRDYLSGDYDSYVEPSNIDATSSAKFRIVDGMMLFENILKVTSLASGMGNVITYLDKRVAPKSQTSVYVVKDGVFVAIMLSYINAYIGKFKMTYSPIYGETTGDLKLFGLITCAGLDD